MKSAIFVALVVCAFGTSVGQAATPSSVPPNEISQRAIVSDQGRNMLLRGETRELDATYRRMVSGSERTSSGLWKSGLFLSGVEDMFILKPRDEAAWDRIEAISDAWVRQEPGSVVAQLVHVELLVQRAWSIRGGGYAAEVPDAAWAPFKAGLRRAMDDLESRKATLSKYPDYYALCIRISKGLDGGMSAKPMECLEAGMKAYPGYYPMYFEMLDYLLPKWHGDVAAVEGFARGVVEKTRASEGEGMYARIYWFAAQSEFRDALFLRSGARWGEMRAGFEDVVARYPDEWNIQNYAKFACLANDLAVFARERARMKEEPITEAWGTGDLFAQCRRAAGEVQA